MTRKFQCRSQTYLFQPSRRCWLSTVRTAGIGDWVWVLIMSLSPTHNLAMPQPWTSQEFAHSSNLLVHETQKLGYVTIYRLITIHINQAIDHLIVSWFLLIYSRESESENDTLAANVVDIIQCILFILYATTAKQNTPSDPYYSSPIWMYSLRLKI
jgi:hypothetical protein